MTTKASREKNDTDEDGRGQDRVTGAAGQDHARSARDHVTEIVTAEDEKPRVKNVFLKSSNAVVETTLCNPMLYSVV